MARSFPVPCRFPPELPLSGHAVEDLQEIDRRLGVAPFELALCKIPRREGSRSCTGGYPRFAEPTETAEICKAARRDVETVRNERRSRLDRGVALRGSVGGSAPPRRWPMPVAPGSRSERRLLLP